VAPAVIDRLRLGIPRMPSQRYTKLQIEASSIGAAEGPKAPQSSRSSGIKMPNGKDGRGPKRNAKNMKKITLGFAAAALLGLASFSVPAVAFQAPMPGAAATSDTVPVQFRHRHHRVCKVRTVVTRYHGRRVVKKVRTCR